MLNLKKYRELKGVSQTSAAKELGISRQTYNNYELGKRQADYEMLLKLAEYFDTTVENLLKEPSDDKPIVLAYYRAGTRFSYIFDYHKISSNSMKYDMKLYMYDTIYDTKSQLFYLAGF